MGTYSTLESISEFVEFAFAADLLSAYHACLSDQMYASLVSFHTKLF